MNSWKRMAFSSLGFSILFAAAISNCIPLAAKPRPGAGNKILITHFAATHSPSENAQAENNDSTTPGIDIPAGTILPIRVPTISSAKSKKGSPIKGEIMQDVPLGNGEKIRKGATVLGHVADVTAGGNGQYAAVTLVFDTVIQHKNSAKVVTNLRALASTLEVEFAQIPSSGPGESDVYDWLTTVQVGGEVVYGKRGEVAEGTLVVGHSVNNGVLAEPRANAKCRGPMEGNDTPQAFWVFSSNACGVYGFSHLLLSHAGRTEPVGEIVLISEQGPVRIRGGSGMLLRVER